MERKAQMQHLPLVWAGPILRRMQPSRLTFWLAVSSPVEAKLILLPDQQAPIHIEPDSLQQSTRCLKAGKHLYFLLIDLPLTEPLPQDCWIGYDFRLKKQGESEWLDWQSWAPDLCYPDKVSPGFVLRSRIQNMLHGSCRKPHHRLKEPVASEQSPDGLNRADDFLQAHVHSAEQWPSVLILSGDQIYADDVAAPMLVAIHRFIQVLGLPSESFEGVDPLPMPDATPLYEQDAHYYKRETLLPDTKANAALKDLLFGGTRKPIFTSDNAQNHLMTLAEVLAMYLLVWSPEPWRLIGLEAPAELSDEHREAYQQEQKEIASFAASLSEVRRVLAHLPVAMIFDDHDITDDWNLTAQWEQTAYGNPLSNRIIGNTLLGYLICQGWGNAPEKFSKTLMQEVQEALSQPGEGVHEQLIEQLYRFSDWHYRWDTQPVLLVLDTRTRRWRSERSLDKPSGLMDWEAITDLQADLVGRDAVVLVSPAPIFGVKLIESIQKVFTWFGHPLMVDAENWMAHRGSAHALMNLFRHSKTPRNFVILSGNVHYSFVYDIELRGRQRGPDIWQITSSGLRNEFPTRLLDIFDRLNRWLYAPWSPLNWLTKRRRMKVIPRRPVPASRGKRLVNDAGIGLVELSVDGRPVRALQLCADGRDIEFELYEPEAHWQ